jgi:hypothetical protein
MGRLVDVAGADHAGLLGLINRAETEQPDDPTAWLVASAKQLTCPTPSLFDVGDDYGLNAWTGRQPDVQDELDAATGRRVKAINGQAVLYHARRIAEAAGLGPQWRGNWDALAAWFRGNIEITGQTLAAITRQAERMRAQGNQVASIAVFNEVVRASVRVAA